MKIFTLALTLSIVLHVLVAMVSLFHQPRGDAHSSFQVKLVASSGPIAPSKKVIKKSKSSKGLPASTQQQSTKKANIVKDGLKILNIPLYYPQEAIRARVQGTVIIQIMCKQDGNIQFDKLIKSSGSQILDRAVLYALKQASLKDPAYVNVGKITLSFQFKINS